MLITVLVEETLAKEIAVEAENPKEAEAMVDRMYMNGEIEIDYGDFTGDVDITAREE